MTKKTNFVSIYSSITSNKIVVVITCILTTALLLDTSLGRISNFITSNAQCSLIISTFTIIVITYIISHCIILEYTNKKIKDINSKNILSDVRNKTLRAFQYSISAFLIVVILDILVKHFFVWFKSRKSYVILLYSLSFSVFVVSAIFSVIFVSDILFKLPDVIQFHYGSFPYFYSHDSLSSYLYNGYVISSILSFILMWAATATFLYHYSKKLGKTKYWIIVSLPLIYFKSICDFASKLIRFIYARKPSILRGASFDNISYK